MDTDQGDELQQNSGGGEDEDHPLLVLLDSETIGFSIYADHITDIFQYQIVGLITVFVHF